MAHEQDDPETRADIWTVALDLSDPEHPKAGKPEAFLRTPANEQDELGGMEVYVRPFRSSQGGPGGKWQISTGGGAAPIWAPNGRELFYATLDNHLMVAGYVANGDSFSYSKPRPWSTQQISSFGGGHFYDLAPDGKRFAVLPTDKLGNVHVTFLLNFFDEVRRKIPAN